MLNRLSCEGLNFLPENQSTSSAGMGGECRETLLWEAGAWGWWGAVCTCTWSLHNLVMSPWGRKETEKEKIIKNA